MPITRKPFLREVILERERVPSFDKFPFCLPVIRDLEAITFHPDVTFFIGENGTGKSTLLEGMATALGFNAEGGNKNVQFSSRRTHSTLHEYLKLVKSFATPKDGYFLRAESFYNVASYMDDVNYLGEYGGKSLHNQSHGESFIALLNKKLKGSGLYILDEPEAALSPSSQLTALAIIHELVRANSQLIIATHSPILMSYPNAEILQLSASGIHKVAYRDTEHFRVSKDFLNNPDLMLSHLLNEF
jgi:predicted ATPase